MKSVENIHGFGKTYCINAPVRIAVVILYDFKSTRPNAFPMLCLWMLSSKLRQAKCIAHFALYRRGKVEEIFFR